jgi:hypothetical protein
LKKTTSSYLTFLGLKEGQHRLISEKGGGIPFLQNTQDFFLLLKPKNSKTKKNNKR